MSFDFNVSHIPFRFFCDRLVSNNITNNLIIESSSNNIELNSNNQNFIFNNNAIFNYGINLQGLDVSNIQSITAKSLNVNTLFLKNKGRSLTSIEDYGSIDDGYIRATTIANDISGRSSAYFTYIDVSGGDSSFNNSAYIKNILTVNGSTTISNDLFVNGTSFVTLYNAINNYIINNSQQLVTAKVLTNDLSATNISISNELIVHKTSFLNDLSINGELLNNVLKVPGLFTIDPSGHGNASGTLIVNGDLMVYGNNTIIASSIFEISDVAISVASNLINKTDLSGNGAGLNISNVASLKYDGSTWNFVGGQLSVENKRVGLDVSFIDFRSFSEASLNSLNNYFDLSYDQLKINNDNSYNAIYSRSQIDNSFMLITQSSFDISYLRSYVDNSFVTKLAFDGSFNELKTYLDASYIANSSVTTLPRPFSTTEAVTIFNNALGSVRLGSAIGWASDAELVAVGGPGSSAGGVQAGEIRISQTIPPYEGYRQQDQYYLGYTNPLATTQLGQAVAMTMDGVYIAGFQGQKSGTSAQETGILIWKRNGVTGISYTYITKFISGLSSIETSLGYPITSVTNNNCMCMSSIGSYIYVFYSIRPTLQSGTQNTRPRVNIMRINPNTTLEIVQVIQLFMYVGGTNAGSSIACSSTGNDLVIGDSADFANDYVGWSGNVMFYQYDTQGTSGYVSAFNYKGISNLAPTGGNYSTDNLGFSIAMSSDGNVAVAGGPTANSGIGRIAIFLKANGTWVWQQNITGLVIGQAFGYSVALNTNGTLLTVGCGAGSIDAYVFERSTISASFNGSTPSWRTTTGAIVKAETLAMNSSGTKFLIGDGNTGLNVGKVSIQELIPPIQISNLNVIDSSLNFLSRKLDLSYVSNSVFEGSFNKLKEQIELSFASVSLTSLDSASISVETINTRHYTEKFNNILWNQIGLDISSGPPLTNNNKKVAISNDGKVVAFASSSHSDISKGRIYVYELSYNQAPYRWNLLGLSSEIIVGQSNDDQFGWDLALSSNGRVVAGSSITNDAAGINYGQVRVYELSNNTNRWTQKGFNINGLRFRSESGYSISLAGNGNRIAIGAWKDFINGINAGAVRVYDFSASINDWRQQGQTIGGSLGSFEGYSTALSLDGQTLASASIFTTSLTRIGGTVSIVGEYIIHSFTTVGSSAFIPDFSGNVEVLIVGGGGGGGSIGFNGSSGGGGAGGVVYIPSVSVSAGTNYSIVIGDGGASGANGQNSSAFTAIAAGGGRGGLPYPTNGDGCGNNGGSGGGAGGGNNTNIGGISSGNSPGTNSNAIIHGNNGGSMTSNLTDDYRAAGGGGAGTKGFDTDTNSTADGGQFGFSSGGDGIMYNILGPSYYWGGGGGGAGRRSIGGWGGRGGGGGGGGAQGSNTGGPGGGSALTSGGAGNVVGSGSIADRGGGNGGANTGGGGGGGSYNNVGGRGGSGIVIIRYLVPDISRGLIKTFTISGNTLTPKGNITGYDINFGRSMKLSANGNTIVIGAPVNTINTWWSYNAWTNDASTGLDSTSSYTVAVNLGDGKIATTVNGVAFQAHALSGTNFSIGGVVTTHPTSPTQNITGAGLALAGNFIFDSTNRTVTLTNLTIGATYKTSFFSVGWDANADTVRNQTFTAVNNGPGVVINPNIYGQYMGIIINCTFVADNTGTQLFTITSFNQTFHMYALANRLISLTNIYNVGRSYVYTYTGGTTWTQLGQTIQGISGGDEFGSSVAISNDGSIVSIGSDNNSSNRGHVRVFAYANNYWKQVSSSISGKTSTSRAGIHALSGDGTTLIQSNNTYNSVYGINKTLAVNSPMTTISGNLIVLNNISVNSLDISTNHVYSSNGYSYKMFNSDISSAIMKEYYSDVTSSRHLKVQIRGDGNITNRNNSYRALSDSRLKENIVTSGPKLDDLLKVRVVDYTMKGSSNNKYIGVLAQELEDHFPNLVTELEPSPKDIQEGRTLKYKAVNYSSFDAILIKSLQEQNAMLKNITRRIETLEEALEEKL
jgi:hypothetical protein